MALTEGAVRVDGGLTMRAILLLVMLGGFGGCGPSLTGTFTGTLAETVACDGGAPVSAPANVTWEVLEHGGELTVTTGGTCDPLFWRVEAAGEAILFSKMCPPIIVGSVSRRRTFLNGSMTLAEPRLAVSFRASDHVFDESTGATSTCEASALGTLARRAR